MLEFALKRISKMGELVCAVGLLLVPCSIGILYNQQPALSQSSDLLAINAEDFVCYIQKEDGQIINLNKLCGSSIRNYTVLSSLSTIDQQFLESYQGFLRNRLAGSPLVQTALSQAQHSPQGLVQRAKGVCAEIRSGQNLEPQPQGDVDADIINIMAVKYYCPDLDD